MATDLHWPIEHKHMEYNLIMNGTSVSYSAIHHCLFTYCNSYHGPNRTATNSWCVKHEQKTNVLVGRMWWPLLHYILDKKWYGSCRIIDGVFKLMNDVIWNQWATVFFNKGGKLNVLPVITGGSHMQQAPRLSYWPALYPVNQNFTVLEIQVSEKSHKEEISGIGLLCTWGESKTKQELPELRDVGNGRVAC